MATQLLTVQDFVSAVREMLQDNVDAFQYGDQDILMGLNAGLQEAARICQFLFRASSYVVPSYTTVNADPVVFSARHKPALVFFIVGWLQLRAGKGGGESETDKRASGFVKQFRDELVGVA